MIGLQMKSYNMLVTYKQQKYWYYHLENLINQYLTGEEILPRDQRKVTEQAKIAYSPLGKAFEIQTKMITKQ